VWRTSGRCEIRLSHVLPLLAGGVLFAASNGWAQSKARVRPAPKAAVSMAAQGAGGLSLSFVNLSDGAKPAGGGILDLGTVSYGSSSRNSNVQVRSSAGRIVVSTRVGLSLQDPAQHLTAASLFASQALPESSYVLWLDGIRLTTTPQIIQGWVPVGKISAHRLEIEVPNSVTEKNPGLHNSIIFQVVPN